MKQADVKIGETYETRIGGWLIKVKVVEQVVDYRRTYGIIPKDVRRVTFRVQRVDNGRVLPKTRSAAALHPVPKKQPKPSEVMLPEDSIPPEFEALNFKVD